MFSWYKYLIVSLVFSHLGFWSGSPSGSLFLIAPFPDLCLLVLFQIHRLDFLVKYENVAFSIIFAFSRKPGKCAG